MPAGIALARAVHPLEPAAVNGCDWNVFCPVDKPTVQPRQGFSSVLSGALEFSSVWLRGLSIESLLAKALLFPLRLSLVVRMLIGPSARLKIGEEIKDLLFGE